MALTINHAYVATGTDAANAEVRKAQWNNPLNYNGTLDVANGGTGDNLPVRAFAKLEGNGRSTITSASGTTVLTNTAPRRHHIVGTGTQTIRLPDVTTLTLGTTYIISAVTTLSSGCPIQSSGANVIATLAPGAQMIFISVSTTNNTAAGWDFGFQGSSAVTGSGLYALATSPTITTPTITNPAITTGTMDTPVVTNLSQVSANITGALNSSAGAASLTSVLNYVTSTPNNPSGVRLPNANFASAPSRVIKVFNNGGSDVRVFPDLSNSNTIDGSGSNTVTIPPGSSHEFVNNTTTNWMSSFGYSGLSGSLTTGIGYGSGRLVGGFITQATSRATGVTLNKLCGQITLFTGAPSAVVANNTFTVTNSTVTVGDTIVLSFRSGNSNANAYVLYASAVAAGSFNVAVFSTAGTTSDTPIINFAIIRATAT